MDDLLADFVAETREMLDAIGGELVAWESDPGERARLDAIFRFVHTVKGNCGFFDFPRLERLSHAAESALAEVRAGRRRPDSRLVSAVLAIIDRISQMVDTIEAGEPLADERDDDLIAFLEPDASDLGEIGSAADQAGQVRSAPNGAAPRTIRLPVELLDRVMSGVSDMVLARNDLARRLRESGAEPTLDGPFERLSGILGNVREAVTRMRMQRIEHLYSAFPRLVRDLSAELGKQVMLDFEGGDVELDREMIEMIRDPIVHLVRNAIDHGIEPPSERIAAGKREIGLLSLAARQSGNTISIVIADDGRGLNLDKIGTKALAVGLVSAEQLAAMPRERVADLIFEAGLSTADEVSAVSGRGVGMDVVRANIEKVGGSIKIASQEGLGTQLHLQIPLTLSIISALIVSVRGQCFAIAQSGIEEIAHGASDSIEFCPAGKTDLITFRGRRIPCLSLDNVLGLGSRRAGRDQRLVLLRLGNGDLFALGVDRIHDQEDLVIKPLAPAVMDCGLYAGSTLLDDGNPVLMLDIPKIAQAHGLAREAGLRAAEPVDTGSEARRRDQRTVMTFVALDGRQRAIALDLVARIDQVPAAAVDVDGKRRQVVVDGQLMTLVGPEPAGALPDPLPLLRLSDGEQVLAYAVARLGDTASIDPVLAQADSDEPIEGVALIDGQPVPVVDGFSLFARYTSPKQPDRMPVCRLPAGDQWVERMLAPLVTAAGYAIAEGEEDPADVVLAIAGQDLAPAAGNSASVITIHATPDHPGVPGQDVYRYDRDGLIAALRHAAAGKVLR